MTGRRAGGAGAEDPWGASWTAAELAADALDVAPRLLGSVLVTGDGDDLVAVRVSEVEAYHGEDDPGSHGYRGRTPRTEVMFGPPGHLYVYFSYGMHWCANVVCGPDGRCSAVLLRAGEVVVGHDVAAARRPGIRPRDQARGPARLTRTLGIDGSADGSLVVGEAGPLRLHHALTPVDPEAVRTGPRVGVSGPGGDGESHPWRFWVDGDPTVSAYRPAVRRPPRHP